MRKQVMKQTEIYSIAAKRRLKHTDALTISIISLQQYWIHINLFFTMVNGEWVADFAMYSPFSFSLAFFDSIHSMYNRNHPL